MPPKKKGKANKLARMTDEERARYLLHRANIEEEARRRKQQLICNFMKNKLKREEAFTRINLAKINQQWRYILRQMKVKELNQSVMLLWHSFERAVDRKNSIIDEMLINLQQAEDQYSMNLQSHTETVDKLICLHEVRLEELHAKYVAERRDLLSRRAKERQAIEGSTAKAFEYLQTVMYAAGTDESERDTTFKGEETVMLDDARNNMVTDVEKLSLDRESQIAVLWQKFRKVLGDYLLSTEPRRNQYIKLKAKDTASSNQLYACCRRVNHLYDQISIYREKLASSRDEQRFFLGNLSEERQTLVEYFWDMRSRMLNDNKFDKKQITEMTVLSNEAISNLEELAAKGEKILQLATACRKLETLKEKVMPFGIREMFHEKEKVQINDYDEPLAKLITTFTKLENFWKHYNLVHLERSALILHHKALTEENRQLRAAVRHYLGSISNHGQPEPRPRTTPLRQYVAIVPTAQREGLRSRPVTCIEASTSIAVQHMMRTRRSSAF